MRALFTVSEWPTHWMAMVPTGWALQAAGHQVRVLCAPSQAEPVSRAGLVPVPVLGGMSAVLRNRLGFVAEARAGLWPYPWLPPHPVTGVPMADLAEFDPAAWRRDQEPELARAQRRSFDRALRFARDWRPDLVLHDPVSLEGLLVGQVRQVPSALSFWGPVGTRETRYVRPLPVDHSGTFARHGLPADPVGLVRRVVDPCPASLAPPTDAALRLAVRYLPYNGPGAAREWMLRPARRPRVCVAWSTALSTMVGPASNLLPTIVRALAGLPVEVLVAATGRDAAALGELPPSVRVLERTPLHLVLPGCAAVVHHGGAGSTMTSLHTGVPQLVISCASEQATTGERVAAAGAGRHLPAHLATAGAVAAALGDLLDDPGYATGAEMLRKELHDRPSPARLVAALEDLAA
ncbi:nucleotide disphospho-sugar-binding domain-containing protein [Micromonospora auratinigra]|uniref:UDP:flavonoid glycosyltransferase YjiC, YdhE family n=1 Tax=Micromonospora auratinigra TaxID=261654 RepID=A0A1A8ZGF4_9ACTN|nr:nucleotide disphospho-sugar-binding domain-containing protein [Micromonospora auratinigra]SBT42900.1 UDP:flavonoid glycosyltransferase YjiC, YdhE family [Micromonospora auratinigra]